MLSTVDEEEFKGRETQPKDNFLAIDKTDFED